MAKWFVLGSLCVLSLVFVGVATAEDKADPTGKWTWTVTFNNQSRDQSVTLKLDGDKLTGTMPGRDGQERQIENGSFKDGTVSFTVTRERDGNKFVSKYSGKVEGDKITGKIESERDGQTQSRDWTATRAK